MGCRGSRTGTEENTFVVESEQKLWSRQNTPQSIEAALYKAMTAGSLTSARLTKATSALYFRGSNDIIESIRTGEDSFDGQKLLILALLHSAGTETEKASAIWDAQDLGLTEEMTKSEVEAFIQQLVSACLDFVMLTITPTPVFSTDRIQTWLNNLKQKKAKFAKEIAAVYLNGGEKLTKEGFLMTIAKNAQVNVTNPAVIRARMEEMKMMPAKFASAFAANFTTNLSSVSAG